MSILGRSRRQDGKERLVAAEAALVEAKKKAVETDKLVTKVEGKTRAIKRDREQNGYEKVFREALSLEPRALPLYEGKFLSLHLPRKH